MLDILRKHAGSWMIKAILGAIVVTFIFFFGYSSMRRGSRSENRGAAIATVDGTPISAGEFKFVFDNAYERIKGSFQGQEIPEFARKMAESVALQQLVGRTLALKQADELGVIVPDQELIDTIRMSPMTRQGGQEFDPIFYRHEMLPWFKNRFGLDYETFLRDDLKVAALQGAFKGVDQTPAGFAAPEAKDATDAWTFEVVTIDPAAMIAATTIASRDDALKLATALVAADPRTWTAMLKPFKLTPQKVGPIGLKERRQLLEGNATFEDYRILFALTPEKPVAASPLERGDRLYIVRLSSLNRSANNALTTWPAGDFFRDWMAALSEKAKVVSHLRQEP
jgi:hypothetical protein